MAEQSFKHWYMDDDDRKFGAELEDSLPERMFDLHAHIYRMEDLNLKERTLLMVDSPEEVSVQVWKERLGEQVGKDRLKGALFLPFPTADGDANKCNEYVISQLEKVPDSRGSLIIGPNIPEDDIRKGLENPGIRGFKPYHCYSPVESTFDSMLADFIPEWSLNIANEK